MKKRVLLLVITSLSFWGCTSTSTDDNEATSDATSLGLLGDNTVIIEDRASSSSRPVPTDSMTPRMEEIQSLLIGDWMEDSMEFKRIYKMPPPPAKNTRVRYQEDGFVYIPDVLLTKEHWDTWKIFNDTTLHIIKRQGFGTRTFIIDSISQDYLRYRLLLPPNVRKFTLRRINK